jgi:hypothetical protein
MIFCQTQDRAGYAAFIKTFRTVILPAPEIVIAGGPGAGFLFPFYIPNGIPMESSFMLSRSNCPEAWV